MDCQILYSYLYSLDRTIHCYCTNIKSTRFEHSGGGGGVEDEGSEGKAVGLCIAEIYELYLNFYRLNDICQDVIEIGFAYVHGGWKGKGGYGLSDAGSYRITTSGKSKLLINQRVTTDHLHLHIHKICEHILEWFLPGKLIRRHVLTLNSTEILLLWN